MTDEDLERVANHAELGRLSLGGGPATLAKILLFRLCRPFLYHQLEVNRGLLSEARQLSAQLQRVNEEMHRFDVALQALTDSYAQQREAVDLSARHLSLQFGGELARLEAELRAMQLRIEEQAQRASSGGDT